MRLTALLLLIALLVVTLVHPPYPTEQWLQHGPTVVMLGLLACDLRSRRLSTVGFLCVVAFFALHVVGARWLYSMVPYDRWLAAIGLPTTADAFGWTRNHYDRLVHLSFGLLMMRPAVDLLIRSFPMRTAVIAALVLVTAAGGAYEIFEWLLAVVMSPDAAERYNGQQGDFFDAQKDMALALLGSVVVAPFIDWKRDKGRAN